MSSPHTNTHPWPKHILNACRFITLHICTHMYLHLLMCTVICIYMYPHSQHTEYRLTHMLTNCYIYIYIYIHTYTHTHTHLYMVNLYAYIHAHKHTHTHTHYIYIYIYIANWQPHKYAYTYLTLYSYERSNVSLQVTFIINDYFFLKAWTLHSASNQTRSVVLPVFS